MQAYHKTKVRFGRSFASVSSLACGQAVKKGGGLGGLARRRGGERDKSQAASVSTHLRRLFAVPPPLRPACCQPALDCISLLLPTDHHHKHSSHLTPHPPRTSVLHQQTTATPKSLSCERLLPHHLSALIASLLCRLPDAGPGRRDHVDSLLISETIQRESSDRIPGAHCRLRASRHLPSAKDSGVRLILTGPLGITSARPYNTKPRFLIHILCNGGNEELRFSCM